MSVTTQGYYGSIQNNDWKYRRTLARKTFLGYNEEPRVTVWNVGTSRCMLWDLAQVQR